MRISDWSSDVCSSDLWLEARRRGGQFILRIEDTDRERSTQEAIDAILEAMEWLGLDYDEGPVYQKQRVDRYREVAEQMVAAGSASYAYESKEEIAAMREAAMEKGEKQSPKGALHETAETPRNKEERRTGNESVRNGNTE